jgi:hypothetical protein
MEARDGAERILLNNIIRVRDQAIVVTEVMVGEMGGPRFAKFWAETRVTLLAIYPGYVKPSDPIKHF